MKRAPFNRNRAPISPTHALLVSAVWIRSLPLLWAGRDRDDEIAGIPGVWAKYSTPSLINHLPKNHLTCSGSKPTARRRRRLSPPPLWQIGRSFVGLSRLTLFTPLLLLLLLIPHQQDEPVNMTFSPFPLECPIIRFALFR